MGRAPALADRTFLMAFSWFGVVGGGGKERKIGIRSIADVGGGGRSAGPKIINLGSARTDLYYERKKYGFKKR